MDFLARAAEAGAADAERLFDKTPREIAWTFSALAARKRAADECAFMAARYIAFAVHAPDRMPPRPVFYPAKTPAMTEKDLKTRLLAWAGKGEKA